MTNVTTDCSTNHNAIGKRIQLKGKRKKSTIPASLPLGITNAYACHKYRFSSSLVAEIKDLCLGHVTLRTLRPQLTPWLAQLAEENPGTLAYKWRH